MKGRFWFIAPSWLPLLQLKFIILVTLQVAIAFNCSNEHYNIDAKSYELFALNSKKPLEIIPVDKSIVKVKMHDRPIAGKDVSKVNVTIESVIFIDVNDQQYIVNNQTIRTNLLELVGNLREIVGHALLPAGEYKQIRIILGTDNAIINNRGHLSVSGHNVDGFNTIAIARELDS